MIIIMSPSKTMDFNSDKFQKLQEFSINEKTEKILQKLKTFSKEELSKVMNVKGAALEKVYSNIHNFEINPYKEAICSYRGTAFKEIQLEKFSKDTLEFLNSHLLILSAFYGLLSPLDHMKEYRLDMTMKIFEKISLYNHWKEYITDALNHIFEVKNEDLLINLASTEFMKMIDKNSFKHPIINVDFKEYKNEKYVSLSTHSKKAKGMMADYLIRKKSVFPEDMKAFDLDGYIFNPVMSSENHYIFTR